MLPPGIPGIIALAGVTIAGIVFTSIGHAFDLFPGMRMSGPQRILQTYALVSGLCALYFWVWAMLNILRTSHFDAGVVSFVFPFGAAAFIYFWQPESPLHADILRRQRWASALSALLPAANYVLGAVLASGHRSPGTLVAYHVSGCVWWSIAAILGAVLAQRQLNWLLEGSGPSLEGLSRSPEALPEA